MKNLQGATVTEAWQTMHNTLKRAGVVPNTYVLYNETSQELRYVFSQDNISYQLVPPYKHRTNLSERAIQTYKAHFKSCLSAVDPNFPLAEWDKLIPQTNLTLNLLRSSRINPKLSAYSYIHGNFNFLTIPLAPPGTRIVAHINPEKKGSYEFNGEMVWYVRSSLNHYRYVRYYFPKTRRERDYNTVEFLTHELTFPLVKLKDHLYQSADDITHLLLHRPSSTVPFLEAGDPTRNAILNLSQLLKRVEYIPAIDIPDHISSPRVAEKK